MKKQFILTLIAAMFCCLNMLGADKIQFTTIKKQQKTPACEYELIIAYPVGNSFVENHIKECINEMLGGTYMGDLNDVNALANHYAKERDKVEREGQSDQEIRRTLREWGYGCESMNYVREEISVAYENSKLINLCHSTEHLMCGQNGSPDYDESYLTVRKSDGSVFGMNMLNEKIYSREFHYGLIEGLKEFFSEEDQSIVITDEQLSECLVGAPDLKDINLPKGEKMHITDKYVEFVYERGEIAIKMVPRVASRIPIKKILPYLTPNAQELLSQEKTVATQPQESKLVSSNVNDSKDISQAHTGSLNIYRANVAMKRAYHEANFSGDYQTFEKGQAIADSRGTINRIKSYNQTYYLYEYDELELSEYYTSCLIPKANVSIESYEIAPLPVSAIGNGCRYTDEEGNKYHIFIASRNNHRFHYEDREYLAENAAKLNSVDRFCVITINDKTFHQFTEYILPIKDGIVDIAKTITNDWFNYDEHKYDNYEKTSFNSAGELISEMYPNHHDKPDWWESVCYVPSKNALYLGEGKFMPLTNNDAIEEQKAGFDNNNIHDVEQQPQFNGNVNSWLAANLRYPPVAAENGIEGRVIVQFVVEEDGSIHDATVVRGVEAALDREALRVVNSMPNWIPARQNGEVVSCKYTFPVVFRLQ